MIRIKFIILGYRLKILWGRLNKTKEYGFVMTQINITFPFASNALPRDNLKFFFYIKKPAILSVALIIWPSYLTMITLPCMKIFFLIQTCKFVAVFFIKSHISLQFQCTIPEEYIGQQRRVSVGGFKKLNNIGF